MEFYYEASLIVDQAYWFIWPVEFYYEASKSYVKNYQPHATVQRLAGRMYELAWMDK